jgi:hypothetical protein
LLARQTAEAHCDALSSSAWRSAAARFLSAASRAARAAFCSSLSSALRIFFDPQAGHCLSQ